MMKLSFFELTKIVEAAPPVGGGMGGGMPGGMGGGDPGLGGGMGGGMPSMGGGMGGGGLGGGMGGGLGGGGMGMGGAPGGDQQPVPLKTVDAMEPWDILRDAISLIDQHDELHVNYQSMKPKTSQQINKSSGLLS